MHKSNQPVHQAQGTLKKLLDFFSILMDKSHFFEYVLSLLKAPQCQMCNSWRIFLQQDLGLLLRIPHYFPQRWLSEIKVCKVHLMVNRWGIVAQTPHQFLPVCHGIKPSSVSKKQLDLSECWSWDVPLHRRWNNCTCTSLSGPGQCSMEWLRCFLGSILLGWKSKLLHYGDYESVKGKFRHQMLKKLH